MVQLYTASTWVQFMLRIFVDSAVVRTVIVTVLSDVELLLLNVSFT